MKSINAAYFDLALTLFACLWFGIQVSTAQNTTLTAASSESIKLPGSGLKMEDIVLKSDAIFVGKITHIEFADPGALGMASCDVEVSILQSLQGTVDAKLSVAVDIYVSNHEDAPSNGSTYVFFIKKVPGRNKALKLLPATDDNIAKVKALIAASPTSK